MWIKICANTSAEDVNLAADNGADAVGFVFAPSPRRVTAAQVSVFTPNLPPDLTRIGVFMTQNYDEIALAISSAGLHGAQLHGELDFSLADKLRQQFGSGFFLIQTLHWDVNADPARSEHRLRDELRAVGRHDALDAILLDSRTASAAGGTGKTLDWARAKNVLSDESGNHRLILAGGLNPLNVHDAIHALHPWGIDVASGVEQYPGKKDPVRLRAFVLAARAAFAEVDKLTHRSSAAYPL